ncbi:MAG: serine hydrolase [Bacteroidota bacterium]
MRKLLYTTICSLIAILISTMSTAQSTYTEQVMQIRKLLDSTELVNNYHGAILIADGEDILLQEAYGVSTSNLPNTIDTQYDLASMGKLFAATAILQLVEQGKLSLDQTVGELLPEYPNQDALEIQVQHLLTHTSGLGDYFGPAFFGNEANIKSLKDFLPYFVDDPVQFTPGELMRYSNAGYIVLGLIIEATTGQGYTAYLEEHIFQPAGMTSTGPLIGSAGGGPSTVTDLYRFALALQNQKLITAASFAMMTTDHFGHEYGYGMTLRQLNAYRLYGHNGGAPGIAGELTMVKGEPLILVTMTNRDPLNGWAQMRTHMQKEFFGPTLEMERFFNTEVVIQAYKEKGFAVASEVLAGLNNAIIDKNTFHYAEQYANKGEIDKAIAVMQLIVQAYAKEWYPYAFLADFQIRAGREEEAIKNYKKSLEINPENEEVKRRLQRLVEKNR